MEFIKDLILINNQYIIDKFIIINDIELNKDDYLKSNNRLFIKKNNINLENYKIDKIDLRLNSIKKK